jgi:hypothetical protein
MKNVNYTQEQTELIVSKYQAGVPVEELAKAVGRSVRSVIAKLSREKVYVAKTEKIGAENSARLTKEQLIDLIAANSGVPRNQLESLAKATHGALEALLEFTKAKAEAE